MTPPLLPFIPPTPNPLLTSTLSSLPNINSSNSFPMLQSLIPTMSNLPSLFSSLGQAFGLNQIPGLPLPPVSIASPPAGTPIVPGIPLTPSLPISSGFAGGFGLSPVSSLPLPGMNGLSNFCPYNLNPDINNLIETPKKKAPRKPRRQSQNKKKKLEELLNKDIQNNKEVTTIKRESPDVIYLEGPIPKKPKLTDISVPPEPVFKVPYLPFSAFLPPTLENREIPKIPRPNVYEQPAPIMTPNQKAYITIQQAFGPWRYNYFRKRALQDHTNCLIKRRMCFMLDHCYLDERLSKAERTFRLDTIHIFAVIPPEDRQQLCKVYLKNCVEYGKFLSAKEKEMEPADFYRWMRTQLNYELAQPYYLTKLPTFKEVLSTISDGFKNIEDQYLDCDEHQIQQLINSLQYDWTDPNLYPKRIEIFSKVIKLKPDRIMEILELARNSIRELIKSRDYYWSIDQELPPLYY